MEQEDIKRSMRFPSALYARLERVAKQERRTVLSQIIRFLEEGVARYEQEHAREQHRPVSVGR